MNESETEPGQLRKTRDGGPWKMASNGAVVMSASHIEKLYQRNNDKQASSQSDTNKIIDKVSLELFHVSVGSRRKRNISHKKATELEVAN